MHARALQQSRRLLMKHRACTRDKTIGITGCSVTQESVCYVHWWVACPSLVYLSRSADPPVVGRNRSSRQNKAVDVTVQRQVRQLWSLMLQAPNSNASTPWLLQMPCQSWCDLLGFQQ